jgi:hypothetical protein
LGGVGNVGNGAGSEEAEKAECMQELKNMLQYHFMHYYQVTRNAVEQKGQELETGKHFTVVS